VCSIHGIEVVFSSLICIVLASTDRSAVANIPSASRQWMAARVTAMPRISTDFLVLYKLWVLPFIICVCDNGKCIEMECVFIIMEYVKNLDVMCNHKHRLGRMWS
jgi:hypothetical protein